jgi:hypothetical protein
LKRFGQPSFVVVASTRTLLSLHKLSFAIRSAIMLGWMALAVAVSLPVLCLLCFPTVLLRPLPDSQKNGRTKTNVLLLVAHPDDESMFFGPTLLSLSKLGGYSIRVICLSTGLFNSTDRFFKKLSLGLLQVPNRKSFSPLKCKHS